VPILNSFGFIIAGVWSLFIIKRDFGIKFIFQRLDVLKYHLKDGWHVFVASLSGNLYGQGNIIILGLFTSPIIVGYYSLALKLSGVAIGLFQVVAQAVFPYLAKLKNDNLNKFKIFTKKIMIVLAIVNVTFIGSISLFSNEIYTLVSGIENDIGYYIFSFWLVIAFITIFNVLFNIIIIALKQDGFMSKMYLFVGIAFLMYGSILTHLFLYRGMLYSMLLVELTIFTLSIVAIKKGLLRSESV
jgi:PST family polysaccharide transporter